MAKSRKSGLFGNPFIKKVAKTTETSDVNATYVGTLLKCVYFLLFIVAGVALAIVLHLLPLPSFEEDGFYYTINSAEIIVAGISFLLLIVLPIICAFVRKALPVLGAISCVGIGYFIAFIGNLFPDYKPLVLLALVLTFSLVVAMLIVFAFRIVKSNSKFFRFLYSVLIALSLSSLLLFICSFIPVLNTIPSFIFGTPLLYVSISVLYVLLGCGFLLSDFESMRSAVECNSPKSVEWLLAYAIVFDVIWIFFEILDLLTYLKSND